MSSTADIFLKATLVGVGGTIVLDLYALMISRILGVPVTNWAMVGRWFGNMAWPIHIASGLARGMDTAAHLAALELGTIAVLAAGIDNVYPPENEELHRAIAEQGLLISERAPSFSPRGKDFPRRNRLISGISLGVVRPERKQHKFWRRP